MTDQQVTLSESPWTPGPWIVGEGVFEPGISATKVESSGVEWEGYPAQVALVHDIDTFNVPGIGDSVANTKLIALAPEMAEAILRLNRSYDTKHEQRAILAVCELAKRLQAIGGHDDQPF